MELIATQEEGSTLCQKDHTYHRKGIQQDHTHTHHQKAIQDHSHHWKGVLWCPTHYQQGPPILCRRP